MMTGAGVGFLSVGIGTAIGLMVQEKNRRRAIFIQAMEEMFSQMQVLLEEESLGLVELCRMSVENLSDLGLQKRIQAMGQLLGQEPLWEPFCAYETACQMHPCFWEEAQEQEIIKMFLHACHTGSLRGRQEAVRKAKRKLEPLLIQTQKQAQTSAKLSVQVGMLVGAMIGIVLW